MSVSPFYEQQGTLFDCLRNLFRIRQIRPVYGIINGSERYLCLCRYPASFFVTEICKMCRFNEFYLLYHILSILLLSHPLYFAVITSSLFCCYHILSILLLSHPLIFFRFFYQYMAVFLFNVLIYVFLLKEFMYSYSCLYTCILFSSMYSYCCLCILIVHPCILIVDYVYLLLSMYSQRLP